MKKIMSILATTAMAFSFMGSNLAYSCGSGCNCGCQSAPNQQCSCGCPTHRNGCPVSKEDFAKILAEKQANLATELELTKPQQDKMKAIFDAKMKALTPVIEEIRAKKHELRSIEEMGFEFGKIQARKQQKAALAGELSALKDQRKAIAGKYHQEFEAILTDAQKVKWNQIKEEHHKKWKEHKHRHNSCGCCHR